MMSMLMMVGLAAAGFAPRVDAPGSILVSSSLRLPSTAAPRLMVAEGAIGIVLHPSSSELSAALISSRVERTVPGDFHDYAVRSLDVTSLDGVAAGSGWQVLGPEGTQHCTVAGFSHIASVDATISDLGAPCGEPLVIAEVSCEAPLNGYMPHLAVPDGRSVHAARPLGGKDFIEDISDPRLAPLVATDLFQRHRADRVFFSVQALSLRGENITLLSGSVLSEESAVPIVAVFRDGQALLVREGTGELVVDLDGDGEVEVLGMAPLDNVVGYATHWVLADARGIQTAVTLSWCEAGC
ncbi:MAG: hypothetical protein ACI8S6_000945 [Myxococcota bacterium]|jgi:hypothetical protein